MGGGAENARPGAVKVAATKMNDSSSRSHSVFFVTVGQRNEEGSTKVTPRPAAAIIPMENPYCSCTLTRVRSRCQRRAS